MEISITWNICRVCLQEENKDDKDTAGSGQMRHLFHENIKLAKNIFDCSGVMMKPNDGLPEKICPKCLKILKYAIYFRKTCRQSDANLQTVLQRTKSASTMFKQDRGKDTLAEVSADDPLYYEEDDVEESLTSTNNFHDSEEEPQKTESDHISHKRKGNHQEVQRHKKAKSVDEEQNTPLHTGNLAFKYENDEDNTDDIIAHEDEEGEIAEPLENSEDVLNQTMTAVDGDISKTSQLVHEQPEQQEHVQDHILELKHNSSSGDVYNTHTNLASSTDNLVTKILEAEEIIDNDDGVDGDGDGEIEHMAEEESENSNLKDHNDRLYYIINNAKEDGHSNEHDDPNETEEDHLSDDNVDFVPLEDDVDMQHMDDAQEDDDDADDNQSHVTSTVVTKEEIDSDDANSNISDTNQHIDAEYIVDEFIIDDGKTSPHNNLLIHSSVSLSTTNQRNFQKISRNITEQQLRKVPVSVGRKHGGGTPATSTSQNCVCELCGNNFTSRQLLNLHMKIHRQEKAHECELCSKRFITACNLQAHMRIHTGEKPYQCKYCGRRFSDRSTHIRHERIHTNEKPFNCENCGKAFALATTLQAHLKVHTGERPYRCEPCAKSFKLAHQLKAHQNTSLHKAVEQLGFQSDYMDA